MTRLFRALPLLTALLLVLAPVARPQEEGESVREMKVREILDECEGAPPAEIWSQADRLVAIGPAAKRAIQRGIADAGIEGRLAGLRAMIALESPTWAAARLEGIARDEELATRWRLMAIELLGLTEEPDAEVTLIDLLASYDPQVKIEAARALWRLGTPRSHHAKLALREMLKASDPEIQAQGALALAEIGDGETPGVLDVLRRLRNEPGTRGQLADALYQKLKLLKTIQIYERNADRGAGARPGSELWTHLDEIRRLLREAYDMREDIEDERLREQAARGMVSFPDDPHTLFLTPDQYHEFLHGSAGVDPSYGGIGAFIDTNVKDRFRILRPIFGGPAWKADLRGGDDIVAVNGVPTAGRETSEIISQVKGPAGTPVVLTIYREGWTEPREVEVIRAKIVLPSVTSRMLPGDIGFIDIAQFAQKTGDELREQLTALEAQGMRGLVIDLRDNPGGLLPAVKECLTLFLRERELICTVKGRVFRPEPHYSARTDRARTYPISVLVSDRSASGAELMSGVLQHYSTRSGRAGASDPYVDALVLGSSTFGKGTVQHTIPLRSWPGEPFEDEPRKDGWWDRGEPFQDLNGNGRWDPGEPFEDRARPNGRWDDAERWEDKNGNGRRDPDEAFTDENGDGVWNPAEEYTDRNGNDRYDTGAALKLTIARYYLPGGENFTREREFVGGEYVYRGGVEPDLEVENPSMEVSDLVILRDLQEKDVFKKYVAEHWDEHTERLRELAWFDARDPSRYPGFDEFYEGLQTRLTRQEVRRGLRMEVRMAVMNEIGRQILGDLSDDEVLRRGVREVLKRLGTDPDTIPEYASLNHRAETR